MSRHRRQRNRRYQKAIQTPQVVADLAYAERYFNRTGHLVSRWLVCPLARCITDRKIDAMMERWMESKFKRFNGESV